MENYEPQSHLNSKSVFFGLSFTDISGIAGFLAMLLFLNKSLVESVQFSYGALLATITLAIILIPIRLTFRRHILRDAFLFLLKKGSLHAPTHRRFSKNK